MSKFLRIALLAGLGVIVAASAAFAVVPDPTFSTVGNCLVIAPGGEYSFSVVVRDQFNNPIGNSSVTIDFSGAAGSHVCSAQDAGFTSAGGNTITGTSAPTGLVTFTTHGGGSATGTIKIYASGVQIASLTRVVSPDITGDFFVNVSDLGAYGAAQLSGNLAADFNCDGFVNVSDLGLFAASQLNHSGDVHCP